MSNEDTSPDFPVDDQLVTTITVIGGEARIFSGHVVVAKPRGIVVRMDVADGDPTPARGQKTTLLYGGVERVLHLKTQVTEVIDRRTWLCMPLGEPVEGERRDFLRAEASAHMIAEVVPAGAGLTGERPGAPVWQTWPEKSIDLSGSGARWLWDQPCAMDDRVRILCVIPTREPAMIEAVGAVVRAKDIGDDGILDVAIHFDRIGEADRERLVNFVFRRHYEQLGARLGTVIDLD